MIRGQTSENNVHSVFIFHKGGGAVPVAQDIGYFILGGIASPGDIYPPQTQDSLIGHEPFSPVIGDDTHMGTPFNPQNGQTAS